MNSRKFAAVMVVVVAVAFGILYVAGAVYPRTFSILSYSVAGAQVSPMALTTTEDKVPVIITLKRDLVSAFTVTPQAFVIAASEDFTRTYGFRTRNQMFEFEMVSGTLPRENLARIASDPRVRGVWYDEIVRAVDVDFSSTYTAQQVTIDEARQGLKLDELGDGSNVSIVVIDSGAAPTQISYDSKWAVASGEPVYDSYGHGTLVSWIIKNLSPNSRLYSIKVLDRYGMGRISDVIAGLEIALREIPKPMVINMSLGVPTSLFDALAESTSATVEWHEGITVVAAAGNMGHGIVLSPAVADKVIAVGAVGKNLEYLDFSGGGVVMGKVKPDVCSYGVVYGLWLDRFETAAGTSIASPMVTATYARWLSSQQNPEKIDGPRTIPLGTVDLGDEGKDTYYGVGFVRGDVLAQVEGVERETPEGRMVIVAPLVAISLVPAFIAWRKGKES